jgi:hypothetical protein
MRINEIRKENNRCNYVRTNQIIDLYYLDKLSVSIEYDEGTIYKYLITCKKE